MCTLKLVRETFYLNEGKVFNRIILSTENEKNTQQMIVDFIITLLMEKTSLLMFAYYQSICNTLVNSPNRAVCTYL